MNKVFLIALLTLTSSATIASPSKLLSAIKTFEYGLSLDERKMTYSAVMEFKRALIELKEIKNSKLTNFQVEKKDNLIDELAFRIETQADFESTSK